MHSQQNLIEKLKSYGFEPKRINKKIIQQKILQMFDELQIKTTQNMLLKKENDDIKLQITTIKDLFSHESKLMQSNIFEADTQNKIQSSFGNNSQKAFIKMKNAKICQITQKKQENHAQDSQKEYQQNSQQNQSQDSQIQTTTRKNWRNTNNQNISTQLQALIKQNQIIMKRMNIIQTHYIQQQNNESSYKDNKHEKNFDDRATTFSSQINLNTQFVGNKSKGNKFKNSHQRNYSNLDRHMFNLNLEEN